MLESLVDSLAGISRAAQSMAIRGVSDPTVVDLLTSLESHTHDANLYPVLPDKK